MKTIATVCLSCIFMSIISCKKTIDQQKENYVLGVLTEGRWFLENYTENDVDNTSDFQAYEFQFYENGKFDAISSSSVVSGTWLGDVDNLSFTVNFNTSDNTLLRINHVWKWLKSNVGLVFAETATPTQKISIRLRKKG